MTAMNRVTVIVIASAILLGVFGVMYGGMHMVIADMVGSPAAAATPGG